MLATDPTGGDLCVAHRGGATVVRLARAARATTQRAVAAERAGQLALPGPDDAGHAGQLNAARHATAGGTGPPAVARCGSSRPAGASGREVLGGAAVETTPAGQVRLGLAYRPRTLYAVRRPPHSWSYQR